jgi:hypothetical protein
MTINVSKSNAMIFAKARWRGPKPRPMQFIGEPIQWVDTARYLGVILDTRMTGCLISSRSGRKLPKDCVWLALSYTGEAVSPSATEFFCISS